MDNKAPTDKAVMAVLMPQSLLVVKLLLSSVSWCCDDLYVPGFCEFCLATLLTLVTQNHGGSNKTAMFPLEFPNFAAQLFIGDVTKAW